MSAGKRKLAAGGRKATEVNTGRSVAEWNPGSIVAEFLRKGMVEPSSTFVKPLSPHNY